MFKTRIFWVLMLIILLNNNVNCLVESMDSIEGEEAINMLLRELSGTCLRFSSYPVIFAVFHLK